MKFLYFTAMLSLMFGSGSLWAKTSSISVEAQPGRKCTAYLHESDKSAGPHRLAVDLYGSGIYSTAESLTDVDSYLLDHDDVAILTVDKPGITQDRSKDNPAAAIVDDSSYDLHTQTDLVMCAQNALNAMVQDRSVDLAHGMIILGHSEGAIIAVKLYDWIVSQKLTKTFQVQGLILSGVPMEDFKTLIDTQLSQIDPENRDKFWKAYGTKDSKTLKEISDLAYPYWEEAFRTPGLSVTLKEFASKDPDAFFSIYQGLEDKNVSPQAVMDFEKWNYDQKSVQKTSLSLMTRYYQAGHGLNIAAANDMIIFAEALLK